MSTKELPPMTLYIEGGDNDERALIGDMMSQTLIDNGFIDVKLLNDNGDAVNNTDNDMVSILDAVTAMRPQLFKTPMIVKSVPTSHWVSVEELKMSPPQNREDLITIADSIMENTVFEVRRQLGENDPTPGSIEDSFLRRYAASQEEGDYKTA